MPRSNGCSGTTDRGCTRPSAISAQLSSSSKKSLNSPSQPDRDGSTQPDESAKPVRLSATRSEGKVNLTSEVSLLVKVFDRKGNVISQDARLQKLEFPSVPGQSGPRATTTALPISIPSAIPAARIRFALRVDSTGKIGTNNYFLADPQTLEDTSIGLTRKP